MTSAIGRDLLANSLVDQVHVSKAFDQWVMVCDQAFLDAEGRFAQLSDIPRLIEYQKLYNIERQVNENPDWSEVIRHRKIIVHEVDRMIVSIVRFGIETDRLVTLGGTFTFPWLRRKGYAEQVLKFAVNHIVGSGRIAHLIVDQDNLSAVELYRRLGFTCRGTAYVAYLEYDESI